MRGADLQGHQDAPSDGPSAREGDSRCSGLHRSKRIGAQGAAAFKSERTLLRSRADNGAHDVDPVTLAGLKSGTSGVSGKADARSDTIGIFAMFVRDIRSRYSLEMFERDIRDIRSSCSSECSLAIFARARARSVRSALASRAADSQARPAGTNTDWRCLRSHAAEPQPPPPVPCSCISAGAALLCPALLRPAAGR
jgi:hypothetical protein